MKNKALKNLILLGIFAFSVFGANNAMASHYYYSYNNPYVGPYTYDYTSNIGNYDYTSRAASQVQYVSQPTVTQVQYIPQQQAQTIEYVNANTPNNANNNSAQTVKKVATNTNTRTQNINRVNSAVDTTNNSGEYVNYDADAQGSVGTNTESNSDLTALSVNGSGSFMPSSFFQWFLLILLILAILIVARMISKTFIKSSHENPAH